MSAEHESPGSMELTVPRGRPRPGGPRDLPGDEAPPKLRAVPPRAPAPRPGMLARSPRTISNLVSRGALGLRAGWLRMRARGRLARMPRPLRLCLGSGAAPIPGWANIDVDPDAEIRLDLRHPLPLPDASASFVYSEHVIEHLDLAEGLALLRECRRVLLPGGVLRIATPDLARLVAAYQADWRAQDWVRWPGHEWIDSAARMLNVSFREWGHRHVYDHDELVLRLTEAGFTETVRCSLGESSRPELAGLETRPDSLLIVEAVR